MTVIIGNMQVSARYLVDGKICLQLCPVGFDVWSITLYNNIDHLRDVAGIEIAAAIETILTVQEMIP